MLEPAGNHYNRHGIQRVGSVGRTICIYGVVCIAVVCYNHHVVPICYGYRYYATYTLIHLSHSILDGRVYPRMPYHVAIGKVQADEIGRLAFYVGQKFLGYLFRAHLWL